MTAIRSPETGAAGRGHRDNGIQKTARLIDHISQPFVMSVGEVSLERRRLNRLNRQNGKQHRMAGERLLVQSHIAPADFFYQFGNLTRGSFRGIQATLACCKTFRPRFRLTRPSSRWCTLRHSIDSTLARKLRADNGMGKGPEWL